jgi:hypothetical protein
LLYVHVFSCSVSRNISTNKNLCRASLRMCRNRSVKLAVWTSVSQNRRPAFKRNVKLSSNETRWLKIGIAVPEKTSTATQRSVNTFPWQIKHTSLQQYPGHRYATVSVCGDVFEHLHRSPGSRRRRRKGNPVPGGITGSPCSWRDINTGTRSSRLGESRI